MRAPVSVEMKLQTKCYFIVCCQRNRKEVYVRRFTNDGFDITACCIVYFMTLNLMTILYVLRIYCFIHSMNVRDSHHVPYMRVHTAEKLC